MFAVWGTDYDYITDECYKRPCCPECEEPIGLDDGVYRCFSCGKEVEVNDPEMLEWLERRSKVKIVMRDCPEHEYKGKKMGCGGKRCVETHMMRNPVTLEWQERGGVCTRCGRRWIV